MSSLMDRRQHIIGDALLVAAPTPSPARIAAGMERAHALRGRAFRDAGAALARFLTPSWASAPRRPRRLVVDPYRFPDALTLQR